MLLKDGVMTTEHDNEIRHFDRRGPGSGLRGHLSLLPLAGVGIFSHLNCQVIQVMCFPKPGLGDEQDDPVSERHVSYHIQGSSQSGNCFLQVNYVYLQQN